MKRAFFGLSALLVLSLSFARELPGFSWVARALDTPSQIFDIVTAIVLVALFLWTTRARYRIVHPTPGTRWLTAGLALYLLASVGGGAAIGTLALAFGASVQNPWPALIPAVIVGTFMKPLLLAAKALLLIGAVRFLANLLEAPEQPNSV